MSRDRRKGTLVCATSEYDLDALDLDAPDIDNDLESYQVIVCLSSHRHLAKLCVQSTQLLQCRHSWEPGLM